MKGHQGVSHFYQKKTTMEFTVSLIICKFQQIDSLHDRLNDLNEFNVT